MDPVVQPRRWSRSEYYRLADDGYFRAGEKLELLDGEIVTMTPQRSRHAAVVDAAQAVLQAAAGAECRVRAQLPLALGEFSEPEPDLAIVKGGPWDYVDEHPHTALLVVEVADSTLGKDRLRKAPLYAQFGIAEYWIINLNDGLLEVYREPTVEHGTWAYRQVSQARRGDHVTPLAFPFSVVAVADLLPPGQV
jgi:Uma2 family endonuclease